MARVHCMWIKQAQNKKLCVFSWKKYQYIPMMFQLQVDTLPWPDSLNIDMEKLHFGYVNHPPKKMHVFHQFVRSYVRLPKGIHTNFIYITIHPNRCTFFIPILSPEYPHFISRKNGKTPLRSLPQRPCAGPWELSYQREVTFALPTFSRSHAAKSDTIQWSNVAIWKIHENPVKKMKVRVGKSSING